MGHRDLLKRWRSGAAIAALALLILAVGLCCFDGDQMGMGDDAMPLDVCFLLVVVPMMIVLLTGLLTPGLVVNVGLPAFAAVPIAVPKPPPRSYRLA